PDDSTPAARDGHSVHHSGRGHRLTRRARSRAGLVHVDGGFDDRARNLSIAVDWLGFSEAALMQPVHVTVAGVIIALIFAASITGVIYWMMRLPEQTPTTLRVARAVRLAQLANRILVPVQGGVLSDRIVALGAQMAKARQAVVEVFYVIEVPWTLPLNARLTEEEARARGVLDQARRIAERFSVPLET